MKKKLQKEISELALELSKIENDFKVSKVKQSLRLLYEKLAVLEYLEGQLEGGSQSFDSKSFREQNWFTEPEPVPRPEHDEAIVEPAIEKIKDQVAQMPQDSQKVDELLEEVLPRKKYIKNDLEEFASNYRDTPVFERKETSESKAASSHTTAEAQSVAKGSSEPEKPRSINDAVNNGLNIGLNDRLAFIKHLFNGNAEVYAETLSTINKMDSYDHAAAFIKGKVKPEYNYWLEKEEYADRFMAIVEKRFK